MSLIVVHAAFAALRDHGGAEPLLARYAEHRGAPSFDVRAAMPRTEFLRVLEQARFSSGTPALGLALGERLTEASFHVLGSLITTSVSARDALTSFMKLRDSLLGGPAWSLEQRDRDVIIGFPHEARYGSGAQIEAELALTLAYQTALRFWGARAKSAVRTVFAFSAPSYLDRYRAIFGEQLQFDGASNALIFPLELLDRQRPGVSAEVAEAWREFASELLSPPVDGTWSDRVQRALKSTHNLAEVDFEALASRWNISLRSLRRKLEAEQTSLSTLLEATRFERAREQLGRRTVRLSEIAESLGYFEVSSFQRAFKRWSGVAPGAFRRRALQNRSPNE